MNKTIKYIIVSIIIISILSMVSFTSQPATYTFYYADREITIESAQLNEEEAQLIADHIAYGTVTTGHIGTGYEINTSILCILFGHSIETSIARETIHNVYPTSPKCVQNTYQVEICTRESCDYIQTTLIDSTRTSICHG